MGYRRWSEATWVGGLNPQGGAVHAQVAAILMRFLDEQINTIKIVVTRPGHLTRPYFTF